MLDRVCEFLVAPEDVIAAAAGLSAIGARMEELYGCVRGFAGAAAGTPAASAVEALQRDHGHRRGPAPAPSAQRPSKPGEGSGTTVLS